MSPTDITSHHLINNCNKIISWDGFCLFQQKGLFFNLYLHERLLYLHERLLYLHERLLYLHERLLYLHERLLYLHERLLYLHERLLYLHERLLPLCCKFVNKKTSKMKFHKNVESFLS